MAQVKKPKLRQAILTASFSLFSGAGYHNTTVAQIAKQAKVSTANVYSYFPSKIHILYALYEPWLFERLDELEASLKRLKLPHRSRTFLISPIPPPQNLCSMNILKCRRSICATIP